MKVLIMGSSVLGLVAQLRGLLVGGGGLALEARRLGGGLLLGGVGAASRASASRRRDSASCVGLALGGLAAGASWRSASRSAASCSVARCCSTRLPRARPGRARRPPARSASRLVSRISWAASSCLASAIASSATAALRLRASACWSWPSSHQVVLAGDRASHFLGLAGDAVEQSLAGFSPPCRCSCPIRARRRAAHTRSGPVTWAHGVRARACATYVVP